MYGLLEHRNGVTELGNSHVVPHQLVSPFTSAMMISIIKDLIQVGREVILESRIIF